MINRVMKWLISRQSEEYVNRCANMMTLDELHRQMVTRMMNNMTNARPFVYFQSKQPWQARILLIFLLFLIPFYHLSSTMTPHVWNLPKFDATFSILHNIFRKRFKKPSNGAHHVSSKQRRLCSSGILAELDGLDWAVKVRTTTEHNKSQLLQSSFTSKTSFKLCFREHYPH